MSSCVCGWGRATFSLRWSLPDLTQHVARVGVGQGQGSLFVAFADDPQEHPLRVDGRDGQRDSFTDPQAAGVNQRETAAVDRLGDRGDQAATVLVASNARKAFAIGLADFFFRQQWPVVGQGVDEEELDAEESAAGTCPWRRGEPHAGS